MPGRRPPEHNAENRNPLHHLGLARGEAIERGNEMRLIGLILLAAIAWNVAEIKENTDRICGTDTACRVKLEAPQ